MARLRSMTPPRASEGGRLGRTRTCPQENERRPRCTRYVRPFHMAAGGGSGRGGQCSSSRRAAGSRLPSRRAATRPSAEAAPRGTARRAGHACVRILGQSRAGRARVLYERELEPGTFVTWLDPPRDIHSQQGIDGDAMELVLFGKNVTTIPRNFYDPETGKLTTALPQ